MSDTPPPIGPGRTLDTTHDQWGHHEYHNWCADRLGQIQHVNPGDPMHLPNSSPHADHHRETERLILEQYGGTAPGYGYDIGPGHSARHNWEIEQLTQRNPPQ